MSELADHLGLELACYTFWPHDAVIKANSFMAGVMRALAKFFVTRNISLVEAATYPAFSPIYISVDDFRHVFGSYDTASVQGNGCGRFSVRLEGAYSKMIATINVYG